jgi:hypothetical protein
MPSWLTNKDLFFLFTMESFEKAIIGAAYGSAEDLKGKDSL